MSYYAPFLEALSTAELIFAQFPVQPHLIHLLLAYAYIQNKYQKKRPKSKREGEFEWRTKREK